ncbi:MAG: hypothetical protein HP490_02185 [Nitrospira sp.]|nr:hypothetical protein [Nitrospira sp.]
MTSSKWAWTFKCYCKPSNGVVGADVIDEWYQHQDAEVQAEIDATLEFFQNRPNSEWRRPKFDTLTGEICQGLREVRIKAASGEYRILGYFGPARQQFTLLIGFKKNKDSDTERNCKLAQPRRSEVDNDETRARKCLFP